MWRIAKTIGIKIRYLMSLSFKTILDEKYKENKRYKKIKNQFLKIKDIIKAKTNIKGI